MEPANRTVDQLCLHCGLCCDGTIFRDVQLQPGDDAAHLRSLGLPLRMSPRQSGATPRPQPRARFPQPCAVLNADGQCQIYLNRPHHCRRFECALLKAVQSGELSVSAALRFIREARRGADRVRKLLQALGHTAAQQPLETRFRRVQRTMESGIDSGGPSDDHRELFHQLSSQMHRLNLLLEARFYPDPG